MSARRVYFTNLTLLGFDVDEQRARHNCEFDEAMFASTNRTAADAVLHFLLTAIDATHAQKVFRSCWPTLDKRQESEFRTAATVWLAQLQCSEPEARVPKLMPSLLLQAQGERFEMMLMNLSTFALKTVMLRQYGELGRVPRLAESTTSPTDTPDTLRSVYQLHIARASHDFIDACRAAVWQREQWRKHAVYLTEEYHDAVATKAKLLEERAGLEEARLHESGGAERTVEDAERDAIGRAGKTQQMREMWVKMEGGSERVRETLETLRGALGESKEVIRNEGWRQEETLVGMVRRWRVKLERVAAQLGVANIEPKFEGMNESALPVLDREREECVRMEQEQAESARALEGLERELRAAIARSKCTVAELKAKVGLAQLQTEDGMIDEWEEGASKVKGSRVQFVEWERRGKDVSTPEGVSRIQRSVEGKVGRRRRRWDNGESEGGGTMAGSAVMEPERERDVPAHAGMDRLEPKRGRDVPVHAEMDRLEPKRGKDVSVHAEMDRLEPKRGRDVSVHAEMDRLEPKRGRDVSVHAEMDRLAADVVARARERLAKVRANAEEERRQRSAYEEIDGECEEEEESERSTHVSNEEEVDADAMLMGMLGLSVRQSRDDMVEEEVSEEEETEEERTERLFQLSFVADPTAPSVSGPFNVADMLGRTPKRSTREMLLDLLTPAPMQESSFLMSQSPTNDDEICVTPVASPSASTSTHDQGTQRKSSRLSKSRTCSTRKRTDASGARRSGSRTMTVPSYEGYPESVEGSSSGEGDTQKKVPVGDTKRRLIFTEGEHAETTTSRLSSPDNSLNELLFQSNADDADDWRLV